MLVRARDERRGSDSGARWDPHRELMTTGWRKEVDWLGKANQSRLIFYGGVVVVGILL